VNEDSNLFLVLGKYVRRQKENLLTQAIVLLFNRVASFKTAFTSFVANRGGLPGARANPDKLAALSQQRKVGRERDVIVDMEVRRGDEPLFVVESKLDSRLGETDLKRYRSLQNRWPSVRCVFITKHGVDDSLRQEAPKDSIWLSWHEVSGLIQSSSKRTRGLGKFLMNDFIDYARDIGIAPIPKMTAEYWFQLRRLSKFVLSGLEGDPEMVISEAITAAEIALQRLRAHRDAAWQSSFRKEEWWRPYEEVRKEQDQKDNWWLTLSAGYWRGRKRNTRTVYSFVGLELWCRGEQAKLFASYGEKLAAKHRNYDRGDPFRAKDAHTWSAKETKRLFAADISDARQNTVQQLRTVSKKFLASKFTKGLGK